MCTLLTHNMQIIYILANNLNLKVIWIPFVTQILCNSWLQMPSLIVLPIIRKTFCAKESHHVIGSQCLRCEKGITFCVVVSVKGYANSSIVCILGALLHLESNIVWKEIVNWNDFFDQKFVSSVSKHIKSGFDYQRPSWETVKVLTVSGVDAGINLNVISSSFIHKPIARINRNASNARENSMESNQNSRSSANRPNLIQRYRPIATLN